MQNRNAIQGALAIAVGTTMIRHEADAETAIRAYMHDVINVMMSEGVSGDVAKDEVVAARQRCTAGLELIEWHAK